MLSCTGAMSAWLAGNQERQRATLLEVSRADPLTGCLNRRGFEERALAEIGAATRRARQGAVLLLDIDHFKQVNDHHGHAAGDALLRWVVATLRTAVRAPDAIGRLGGDEFAVLFADIEPSDAMSSATRITEALAERAPCSVGLASFPMDGSDLEELMRNADGRLYASRDGRQEHSRTGLGERLSWAATLAHAVDMRMNAQHEHSRGGRRMRRRDRAGARLGGGHDRHAAHRRNAARRRQGDRARPHPLQAGPARRTRSTS